MTDHDLIRDFAATRSEQAFRRLVDRHCDLVFSVASRVTGNADLARDVAQQVFSKLAAKPAAVPASVPLAAWLHRTSRSLAVDLVRSEQARQHREHSFSLSPAMNPEPTPDWSRLEPVIDSLIDELPELERRAVVLRFYEKKSHSAIGSLLGLSEEATRKRLDRAMEKLRALLAKRGIATTSAVLATILPAHAVAPAPVGLSASLSSTALSTATAVAATATSSTSILAIIMSHKAISAAAALLLLAGVTAVAVPALTKDKNAPSSASASAPVPASAGEATPGADAGGTTARAKSKSAATARLSEKYGDSRTKLAGHLSNEVIGMTEDLMVIMDFASQSQLGDAMFHDPGEALGAAAESITLTDEQKAKISELQAASMKRQTDEARKLIADLKKAPESLVEALLLTDALKRGEITKAEFDSARQSLDFPKDALNLALDGTESESAEDDPIFIEELLRVLDDAQGKAYKDALAAKKSTKEAETEAGEKGIMTLEEFETQITSTRKIMRGAAQMMEGMTNGNFLAPSEGKK
ncbi:sigma-70 family RNA polymerase sigma factor [Haloferula sp. BvORR071]|uniref:RNA polymerase sigma factor n=1 Tax=Haloferula sp. BvORR071 TaxID=1396141 RepID=UPI000555112A|nr:sigma-70 family RNA polymerase sigma factor [Haloferula sp. BvORR071]